MRALNKVLDGCVLALAALAGAIMLVTLLAVVFAMFSRYLFGRPFGFLIDYVSYSLVYITFLGAPWVMKIKKHITIDMFVEMMPLNFRRKWVVGIDIAVMFIAGVIFYISAILTIDFFSRGVIASDFLSTPRWLQLVGIPVGCLFLSIQALRNAIEGLKSPAKTEGEK